MLSCRPRLLVQRRQSKYIWGDDRGTEGAKGVGCGRGVPLPTTPSPEFFFRFWISKWRFVVHSWCNFFALQLQLLRGRKVTLAHVYFYWGAIAPLAPPPGIDATVLVHCVATVSCGGIKYTVNCSSVCSRTDICGWTFMKLRENT